MKLRVTVSYEGSKVDPSDSLWEQVSKSAGNEVGIEFLFCLRVNITDNLRREEVNFLETAVKVYVDKTNGLGFELNVPVLREEAGNEDAKINYDADIEAKLCYTTTLGTIDLQKLSVKEALSEFGSSKIDGIDVIGWDNLNLSRNEDEVKVDYDEIMAGAVPAKYRN